MLGLCTTIRTQTRLNTHQRIQLKQLTQLRLGLQHEPFEAIQGIEGMCKADEILKDNDATGLLIGGLSEETWGGRKTPAHLSKHKDVDVLLLDGGYVPVPLEGRIDWWIPQQEKILRETELGSRYEKMTKWWKNAFDVVLSFGVNYRHKLPAGLYLPDRNFVVDMRFHEALANIDVEAFGSVDYDVEERFRETLDKGVQLTLPKFLREEFKDQILSERYTDEWRVSGAVDIEPMDLQMTRDIYKHLMKSSESDSKNA